MPARRAGLGLGLCRLDRTAREVRSFVVETMQAGGGTWVSGPYSDGAEFCVGQGEAVDLRLTETEVTAGTARGALSVHLSEHVRALAFGSSPEASDDVVLALPRERVPPVPDRGLTALGFHAGAVGNGGRGETLYDFGLGSAAGRFGLRTADGELIETLDRCRGLPWPALLAAVGSDVEVETATRDPEV